MLSCFVSTIALAEEPTKSESAKPNTNEKVDATDTKRANDEVKASSEKSAIPPDSEWVHPTK